jgi:integrase
MLGHATITQTMDTYSHVLPGMGDVAARALEEALG